METYCSRDKLMTSEDELIRLAEHLEEIRAKSKLGYGSNQRIMLTISHMTGEIGWRIEDI